MNETPQEYIQRIMGILGGQKPLKIQADTPKKLGRLIQRASSAKLRKTARAGEMVRRRNPCASRGLRNCHGLEDAANSGRARNADSSV